MSSSLGLLKKLWILWQRIRWVRAKQSWSGYKSDELKVLNMSNIRMRYKRFATLKWTMITSGITLGDSLHNTITTVVGKEKAYLLLQAWERIIDETITQFFILKQKTGGGIIFSSHWSYRQIIRENGMAPSSNTK